MDILHVRLGPVLAPPTLNRSHGIGPAPCRARRQPHPLRRRQSPPQLRRHQPHDPPRRQAGKPARRSSWPATRTRAEARIKIATWITDFYDRRRRHSVCADQLRTINGPGAEGSNRITESSTLPRGLTLNCGRRRRSCGRQPPISQRRWIGDQPLPFHLHPPCRLRRQATLSGPGRLPLRVPPAKMGGADSVS